ncbi:MAG TPA: aspartate ammonia-lyase [Planctomycetota bacterium]|nr:aspartate ammonia-lyase [Planctomycetota bacterium]
MQAREWIPWVLVSVLSAAAANGVGAPQTAPQAPPSQQTGAVRTESDLLGEKAVPADAYWGVQTARALENFRISGRTIGDYPALVRGFARTKMAAALANADVGALEPEKRDAILLAGRAVLEGRFHDQFLVDPYQGGAGTSTNMNANEVLANVALELTGHPLGEYSVIDPHDHLNLSQSTNDSYPTALKAAILEHNDELVAEAERLVAAFRAKADEFRHVLKMGRTEMQDAVPMTLGQEFDAFATGLEAELHLLRVSERPLLSINMGGTAIGTGLNAPAGYAERVAVHLAELSGEEFVVADDLVNATWDQHAFLAESGALRSLAVKLSKIASDLILLGSGPRAGLGELNLPAQQPGSSIMPGKVNPVIPELVNVVCFRVIGNDLSVTLSAQSGQLQLNAYEPLEAIAILESQSLLTNVMRTLRERCIEGVTAREDVLAAYIERTIGIVTALNPVLGYERATELAKEALETDKGILELVREHGLLTEEQIAELLDPAKLTGVAPGGR